MVIENHSRVSFILKMLFPHMDNNPFIHKFMDWCLSNEGAQI